MSLLQAVVVFTAGLAAGAINAMVGSGTLITFPTLLAVGLPPVTANVSNTIGLVPGSLSGVIGYRRELVGQRRRLLTLGSASLVGGSVGAALLMTLPPDVFRAVVPVLIGVGVLLVLLQPMLARRLRERRAPDAPAHGSAPVWALVLLTGVYGGYFGAAQGVLLLAIMGVALHDGMQRLNAVKNVLAMLVNGVAAAVFIVVADVSWPAVGLVAGGSVIGAQAGVAIGRRLPPAAYRAVVVLVGVIALARLLG